MAFMQNNNFGNNGYNNNGGNNDGEKQSNPIGTVYGSDARVDIGNYRTPSGTWTTIAIKQSIGKNPATGAASYEQTHPQQLPSVMLTAEIAIALLDATANEAEIPSYNFSINVGGPKHATLSVVGAPAEVKLNIKDDRGDRTITFASMPVGSKNVFASWKLFREYLKKAYNKSINHKIRQEDLAVTSGGASSDDDDAPF